MVEYLRLTTDELKALVLARVKGITGSVEICWGPDVPKLARAQRHMRAIERAHDALIALGQRHKLTLQSLENEFVKAMEAKLRDGPQGGDASCGA